jgi:hypothetical protein
MIDPSPTPDELKNLAGVFDNAAKALQDYLAAEPGKSDPNFMQLTAAAINLNTAADAIAIMQLQLAADQGLAALATINKATAELQKALIVRQEVIRTLGIVQSIVTFGAAIASDDLGSIISSGTSLYNALTSG